DAAGRLRRCVRAEDTVARFGGDEFTILLEELADVAEAAGAAERVIAALRLPYAAGEHEIFVTTSIGIVLSTAGQEEPEDLLRDADIRSEERRVGKESRSRER